MIAAKAEGLNLQCYPYSPVFCDEDLQTYDTNLSEPSFTGKTDMLALRDAVLNGTVDCILHHLPQDWDNKTCEFEYAKMG